MGDTSATSPKGASPGRAATSASPPAGGSPATTPTNTAPIPANTGVLEADDVSNAEDADSALGMDGSDVSDTTSVMSSIFKYREQNGRTYHAYKDQTGRGSSEYIPYFLPNDDIENERLDLQHNLMMLTQDNHLYLCPAGKGNEKPLRRVLDAGCGTGVWSVDMGDEHPEASIVGVDVSPIQPTFVPINVEFFVDDLELEWNYVRPFDLIYLRIMTGSIKDWPTLFRQAYQHLNPGGWIELCDVMSPAVSDDGTLTKDCALNRWNNLLVEATDKLGASLRSPADYQQQLADAGYQNVTLREYKWPSNPWPKDPRHKEIGAWTQMNFLQGLQGLSLMSFGAGLGWSAAEVETLLVDVRKDIRNRNIHAYWPVRVVYAQKPE